VTAPEPRPAREVATDWLVEWATANDVGDDPDFFAGMFDGLLAALEADGWHVVREGESVYKGETRPVQWSCSHCGPSPDSRGGWCAKGCGSDYNQMELQVVWAEP
jgi:hypothetical protein